MKYRLSLLLLLVTAGSLCAGQIISPWRATTAIVEAGDTFEVWFDADAAAGQVVNAVELRSPYLTVPTSRSVENGNWQYDHESGNTYNQRITVTVPIDAPADRYDLILKTSTGDEVSPAGVKVVREFKDFYYIVQLADAHRWQNVGEYPMDVTAAKVGAVIDAANIVGAELVIECGDHLYNYAARPDKNEERTEIMFGGTMNWSGGDLHGVNADTLGLNDASGAVFIVPGNHDSKDNAGAGYNADPSKAYTLDWYNQQYGLAYYNFKYGNGRFMAVNSGMGNVPSLQSNAAASWLNSVGHGEFKVGFGHAGKNSIAGLESATSPDLILVGHNHFIAGDNPHAVNGNPIQYVANALRPKGTGNFEYNLFRVSNETGAFQVLGSAQSRVRVIENHTTENINNPSSWIPMLELNFRTPNDGSLSSNMATITNRHNFAIPDAQVRFIMPLGSAYSVSGGTEWQAFDGDSVHVVDVSVDLGPNDTTTVRIVESGDAPPPDPNNATFVSQDVPTFLDPGQTAAVSVRMKNTGTVTWSSAEGHQLGSQSPEDNSIWGLNRVDLDADVAVDSEYSFDFEITAPESPGLYDFRWRMLDDAGDNTGWFGSLSNNAVIKVGHLPLRIEAENYSDMSGIGTQDSGDEGGGLNVRSIEAGDWMDYVVNVEKAGTYELRFRVASPSHGANFDFRQGSKVLAVGDAPATGDWQDYITETRQATLEAGTQTFRVEAADLGWNFNWFELLYIGEDPPVIDASGGPAVRFDSPPTAPIFAPVSFHLRVNVFNSANIEEVSLFKNGVELERTATEAPYEWGAPGQNDPELQNLAPGSYEFRAVVRDTSGNEGETTITVMMIDPDAIEPIQINFQPASAAVPEGYLADTSQVFADRGNGYSYGWDAPFDRTRERNSDPDKRLDTLNHTQWDGEPDRVWEIELPNGIYDVSITGGDPDFTNSFIEFVAEASTVDEEILASGDADGVKFVSGTAIVTVSDGRLTISNGPNADNNKINFVEITAIATQGSYDAWKTEYGITDDTGDEDNDGISNLLEFALGGDPRTPGTAELPRASVSGDDLVFTLTRQEAGIAYVIEKSTDLVNWDDLATLTDAHGAVGEEATVSVPASEMDVGKIFLRLRVEW